MNLILIYIASVWSVAVLMTVYDKLAAKFGARRISEKTLIITALLGGALPMYSIMRAIRHKTRHAKFMILLPLMVLLHIAILALGMFFYPEWL